METLIIKSESKSTIKLLFELAKKLGAKPVLEKPSEIALDKGLKELRQILNGTKQPKRLEDLIHEK